MAHSQTVKLQAYTLFLQGNTYESIADDLKENFSLQSLSPTTVRNWAESEDGQGETWHDHRRKVMNMCRHHVEVQTAGKAAAIRQKAETIQEALYDQITGEKAPKATSLEGATYAFKTISEFVLSLEKASENMAPLAIVQSILEIFRDIPEVNQAIEKHWPVIRDEIKKRMSQSQGPVIEVSSISHG